MGREKAAEAYSSPYSVSVSEIIVVDLTKDCYVQERKLERTQAGTERRKSYLPYISRD